MTPSFSGGSSSRVRVERDHRYMCLLRYSLAHGAEDGFAYTLIHSGGEEQQIRALKQLVDDPCWVGIE